jgi:hypothetical protein
MRAAYLVCMMAFLVGCSAVPLRPAGDSGDQQAASVVGISNACERLGREVEALEGHMAVVSAACTNAPERAEVAALAREIAACSNEVADLRRRVTQIERCFEEWRPMAEAVKLLVEEGVNRPVIVDWLEGVADTNGPPNRPAGFKDKPVPGR